MRKVKLDLKDLLTVSARCVFVIGEAETCMDRQGVVVGAVPKGEGLRGGHEGDSKQV